MPPAPAPSYWRDTRAPRYSLLYALPLLLFYEGLAFLLSGDAITGVRNGADVLLKSAFLWLGGRDGLVVFGVVLVGVAGIPGLARPPEGRHHHRPLLPWYGESSRWFTPCSSGSSRAR